MRGAFTHYAAALAKRSVRLVTNGTIRRRTPAAVRSNYDHERAYTRDRIDRLSWDELVYGSADRFDAAALHDFVLLDDRVVWAPTRQPRTFLVERIEQIVAEHVPPGGTVVEFGSGNGRNLLHLSRRLPDRHFVGLELSPVSVDLAQRLAVRFELDASFHTCNVCEELPKIAALADGATLVFSAHALEMMPRIFGAAVDNMLTVARDVVALFEPVPELWTSDLRGWASRMRVIVHDRLQGFMPVLRRETARRGWIIDRAERMHTTTNPLNETCEVILRPRT